MSDLKKTSLQSITLKRTVTVKSVVTAKFKEFLIFETNQHIQAYKLRLEEISALEDGLTEDALREFQMEKDKISSSISELDKRVHQIKVLELGSLFTQGMVEGLANVNKGDNFYQTLGAVEIILKDGIVQDIDVINNFMFDRDTLSTAT